MSREYRKSESMLEFRRMEARVELVELPAVRQIAHRQLERKIAQSNQHDAVTKPNVDIAAVYGGGGDAGSYFANDFVELFNSGTTSVSLSWTAPAGTVTGYDVSENGSQVASVTGTTDTVTGLSPSTAYTFTVSAVNSAGQSPASSPVSQTP